MASKRAERRRQCEGKVAHASQSEGMIALRQLKCSGRGVGQMQVYRCDFCRQWHVGHMTKEMRRTIDQRRALA
ncbi:MAG TPA: hypothetical protein VGE85_11540 [Terracidiphilus sp.]|jgi:hypothetical protein